MAYATADELQAWIGIDDPNEDTLFDTTLLDAATRTIDRMCGRHFTTETAVTKLYYPSSADRLSVVDLVSVTSIAVDINEDSTFTQTLATTDYELRPFMDDVGKAAIRFQEIRIRPLAQYAFEPGYLTRIVGTFGWSSVPSEVKQACLILAARYWKRHETPVGILNVGGDIGQSQRIVSKDPDVAALLRPYMRTLKMDFA